MGQQLVLETVFLLAAFFMRDLEIVFAIAIDIDYDICKTPDHWEGDCRALIDCPSVVDILNKAFDDPNGKESIFFDQSRCEEVGIISGVCCRLKDIHLLPDSRNCGRTFENRIHNGTVTHINEYPWTVMIMLKKSNVSEPVCGGSLINNRYVLTAAHCLTKDEMKSNINKVLVRLGEWNTASDVDCETNENGYDTCSSHLDVGIEKVISHPNFTYSGKSIKHDIALIRLDRYVNFTDFIYPVCLPVRQRLRDKTFIGESLDLVGWGITETNTSSLVKRVEYIEGLSLKQCRLQYSFKVKKHHICAGVKQGTHTCWGDSGGPLVSKQEVDFHDVYVLAGVMSFSNNTSCGQDGWPNVYTRVSVYIDWIEETLKD